MSGSGAHRESSAWVVRPRPVAAPRLRLFCLPHAGGGPAIFHRWARVLPPQLDLCAVHLPGRGARVDEPAHTRLSPLLAELEAALRPWLDAPFAFFGHSLGAVLGFELARRLQGQGPAPRRLFASACAAPHLLPANRRLHDLPRAEFLDALRAMGGTPPQLFAEQGWLDQMLPVVRADLTLFETYAYEEGPPLRCAITALGGRADTRASPSQLQAWAAHTGADFRLRLFAGGHFYWQEAQDEVLAAVVQDLDW
ncbi:MAG TPA: alpha/beta fold hydrolase [Candidatus Sulfomarinibacteraceae bacterium]|nr:alpha/beta fold hydrolase [Candidatus Sulfomarinibacteraceae bacterium]